MSPTVPPLLARLIDDAAVFPPGNATVPAAVRAHGIHHTSWYAASIGPLLVPAPEVGEVLAALDRAPSGPAASVPAASRPAEPPARHEATAEQPLRIGLIVRPGSDEGMIRQAVSLAVTAPGRVLVVAAELGWSPGWRAATEDALPTAVEVPRGSDRERALDDIALAHGEGRPVTAKFRTGPTPSWAWPDEAELAAFLVDVVERSVPFKLTGGLHHAVRGSYLVAGAAEDNHGLLNILVATQAARAGAGVADVAGLLSVRDGAALAELVRAWPEPTARGVRAAFTAYGCCTVTDPIDELLTLGLLTKE